MHNLPVGNSFACFLKLLAVSFDSYLHCCPFFAYFPKFKFVLNSSQDKASFVTSNFFQSFLSSSIFVGQPSCLVHSRMGVSCLAMNTRTEHFVESDLDFSSFRFS